MRQLQRGAGRDHADRSPQSSPVPAAALPGGHRRPRRAVDRRAAAPHPARSAQRHGAHGRSASASTPPRAQVALADRRIPYDYLLVASGATHAYFGHDRVGAVRARASRRSTTRSLIRRRVLSAFEQAEAATDDAERDACLTFAVIGAGPTGVGARGHARRDRAAHADARLPPHRSAQGARAAHRGRAARAVHLHRSAVRQGAQAARAARCRGAHRQAGHRDRRGLPACSAISASPRAPSSGPPVSPPHRSANNSAPSSIAPDACACSRT